MPSLSSQSSNSIASGYNEQIERLLTTNFDLDAVNVIPFSAGTHWVSIPLKVAGRVGTEDRVYLAKVVTADGLHTHQDIITNKNARFVRNDIVDISFDGSDSAYEFSQRLKTLCVADACRRASALLLFKDGPILIAFFFVYDFRQHSL
jgi:hypothetical protein